MLRVSIPSYQKIEDNNDSYTVFIIEVCVVSTGKTTTVQKRYSEFENLHKQIKKEIKTPEFPPKKVMKFNNKVLEQRRLALQTYMQGVILADRIPKDLLKFLEVDQFFSGSQESLDLIDNKSRTTHQPMIVCSADAFLHDNTRSGSIDIISVGVLSALYNNMDDFTVR